MPEPITLSLTAREALILKRLLERLGRTLQAEETRAARLKRGDPEVASMLRAESRQVIDRLVGHLTEQGVN